MACLQQVRTSETSQLLPNQVVTEQQSLVVIKKLLAIAVSGITYLRGLFPDKAFGSKYVEDQKVMILREEMSCPGAIQIVQWMQGCFDAIQKKYLRTVILSIHTDPENPQKVTEFYQFRIQYTVRGAQMNFESSHSEVSAMSCTNTKKASILLVRKLYTLMQNLEPLPDNVCLSMKLAYYDNVTPLEYQPPGFQDADCDTMEFEREPVKLSMGEVVTPFHSLKLNMTTERHRLEQVGESVQTTEKWFVRMEDDEKSVVAQTHVIDDVDKPDRENTEHTEIQLICHEKMESCVGVSERKQAEKRNGGGMATPLKMTSDTEVGLKRTRSGHAIRCSTANMSANKKKEATREDKLVCQYDIPSSQETPSSSAPTKKRKFSQPKDHV